MTLAAHTHIHTTLEQLLQAYRQCTCRLTHACTHIQTYIHTYIHTYTHTHTPHTHTHTHTANFQFTSKTPHQSTLNVQCVHTPTTTTNHCRMGRISSHNKLSFKEPYSQSPSITTESGTKACVHSHATPGIYQVAKHDHIRGALQALNPEAFDAIQVSTDNGISVVNSITHQEI